MTTIPQGQGTLPWNGVATGKKAWITYVATIATDCSQGDCFDVTLTGNATFSLPTNLVVDKLYHYIIRQDSTGSRLGTFTGWFATATLTLTTPASSVDVLSFWTDGTSVFCTLTKAYTAQ